MHGYEFGSCFLASALLLSAAAMYAQVLAWPISFLPASRSAIGVLGTQVCATEANFSVCSRDLNSDNRAFRASTSTHGAGFPGNLVSLPCLRSLCCRPFLPRMECEPLSFTLQVPGYKRCRPNAYQPKNAAEGPGIQCGGMAFWDPPFWLRISHSSRQRGCLLVLLC